MDGRILFQRVQPLGSDGSDSQGIGRDSDARLSDVAQQVFDLRQSGFVKDVEREVNSHSGVGDVHDTEDLHLHATNAKDRVGLRAGVTKFSNEGDGVNESLPRRYCGIKVVLLAVFYT